MSEYSFFANREELTAQADKVLFTGMIDEFYDYCYGELEYRSLKFETEVLDMGNYQGNAVVNYTDYEVPYTRIIEHKHFEFGTQPKTVITREYPAAWRKAKNRTIRSMTRRTVNCLTNMNVAHWKRRM